METDAGIEIFSIPLHPEKAPLCIAVNDFGKDNVALFIPNVAASKA